VKRLNGLVYHVRAFHSHELWRVDPSGVTCLVCGIRFEKMNSLKWHCAELAMRGDPMHALAFLVLASRQKTCRKIREMKKHAFRLVSQYVAEPRQELTIAKTSDV